MPKESFNGNRIPCFISRHKTTLKNNNKNKKNSNWKVFREERRVTCMIIKKEGEGQKWKELTLKLPS